jgi:hypothetical protein
VTRPAAHLLQGAAMRRGRGGAGQATCHFDAFNALHSILPTGDEFDGLHAAASAVLGSAGAEPADKVGGWAGGWFADGCL